MRLSVLSLLLDEISLSHLPNAVKIVDLINNELADSNKSIDLKMSGIELNEFIKSLTYEEQRKLNEISLYGDVDHEYIVSQLELIRSLKKSNHRRSDSIKELLASSFVTIITAMTIVMCGLYYIASKTRDQHLPSPLVDGVMGLIDNLIHEKVDSGTVEEPMVE